MATFYLLPPRTFLADRLLSCLNPLLPGLNWNQRSRQRLVDALATVLPLGDNTFLIGREELPAGEPIAESLISGFGAEPGDEIIEVHGNLKTGELHCRRWTVPATLK